MRRTALLLAVVALVRPDRAVAAAAAPGERGDRIDELEDRACAAFARGRPKEARAALDEALRRCEKVAGGCPQRGRLRLDAGALLLDLGDEAGALAEMQAALTLDPAAELPADLGTAKARALRKEILARPDYGLVHQPAHEVPFDRPMLLEAHAGAALRPHHLVLFYRPAAASDYAELEMAAGDGVWTAELPAGVTRSRGVAYYIEARDGRDRRIASAGEPDAPFAVDVVGRPGPAPVVRGATRPAGIDAADEGPRQATALPDRAATAGAGSDDDDAAEGRRPPGRRGKRTGATSHGDQPTLFVAAVGGTGLGYVAGSGEVFPSAGYKGVAWSAVVTEPQVGVWAGPALIELAVRWQAATLAGAAGPGVRRDHPEAVGAEAPDAFAVLGRIAWTAHLDGATLVGGPQGGYGRLRHRVDLRPMFDYIDTIAEGPALGGVYLGLQIHAGKAVRIVTQLSLLGAIGSGGLGALNLDGGVGLGLNL